MNQNGRDGQATPEASRIELVIAGTPRARPRARHGARIIAGKAVSFSYQPKKLTINKRTGKPTPDSLAWVRAQAWYDAVRCALLPQRPAVPWTGPVRCTIDVYFERPQRLMKKSSPQGPVRHTAKPDRDNTDKSILDALTEAGLWEDDAQVCDGPVRKWYVAKGCGPGVIVVAERIVEETPPEAVVGRGGRSKAKTEGKNEKARRGDVAALYQEASCS